MRCDYISMNWCGEKIPKFTLRTYPVVMHTQGFHYVFVQEVSGVLLPGIFSFSYERK